MYTLVEVEMRAALSILLLSLLAGCATPDAKVDEARTTWQGATYDEVVLRWGTPARSAKMSDGRDAYTWVSDKTVSRGGVSPSIGIGIGSGGVGIGTGMIFGSGGGELARCERTLIFRDGRVDEQTWQGPADFCSSFRR